jgi:hypothetical protein
VNEIFRGTREMFDRTHEIFRGIHAVTRRNTATILVDLSPCV